MRGEYTYYVGPLERTNLNVLDPVNEVSSFQGGPNRVGVTLPLPEDGSISRFRNLLADGQSPEILRILTAY
jgi:hypothetical protein